MEQNHPEWLKQEWTGDGDHKGIPKSSSSIKPQANHNLEAAVSSGRPFFHVTNSNWLFVALNGRMNPPPPGHEHRTADVAHI